MQKVYLLCGVPGSGKSWVSEQLQQEYTYIRNDDFIGNPKTFIAAIFNAAKSSQKPILCDCPFAERKLRDELVDRDLRVIPIFIVEHPQVVRRRYESRGKPVYPGLLTRALSIQDRAIEWNAFWGTAEEVLKKLRELSYG
jgi:gluconate kinase